jgi:hypothetical protein
VIWDYVSRLKFFKAVKLFIDASLILFLCWQLVNDLASLSVMLCDVRVLGLQLGVDLVTS